ncbi:MAG TPA: calcium/sodium antiporter [Synechococcales cyanobacterium M55_K2018_004]|nr:calcium/sodium antiporter [Synechococcales cyanobacterium M55_K2018_004]
MNHSVAVVLGAIGAGIGGDLFVRGVVGLAHWARVSAGIIGATVAAFATSSPELSVAISSALDQKPQISLGDVLGSNVVNVALILALALLIAGVQSSRDSIKRDFPAALVTPIVIGLLSLDGVLSQLDGFVLLSIFLVWLIAVILEARRQQSASDEVLGESRSWLAVILCVVGLGLLILAAHLIVGGATGIALAFGVDEFVIGATIVAVGTSMPELATTIVSRLRGHEEVALGTILGSNIFNSLWVVGVAAAISPIAVNWQEVSVALVFGVLTVILTFPTSRGRIERRRGAVLLALYLVYLVIIIN